MILPCTHMIGFSILVCFGITVCQKALCEDAFIMSALEYSDSSKKFDYESNNQTSHCDVILQ